MFRGSMFRPAFFFLATLFVLPASALAEPAAKVGRLKDGRAYRIDDRGYKLIDQLAEYEVSVNELERQVHSLEDELADKNELLAKGNSKVHPEAYSKEATSNLPPARVQPEANSKVQPLDCSAQIQPLQNELQVLRQNAQNKDRLVALSAPTPGQPVCDYEANAKPLREQITNLQNALMAAPSNEQLSQVANERSQSELANNALKTQLDAERARSFELQNQIAALKGQSSNNVAQLQSEIEARDKRIAAQEKELVTIQTALNDKISREQELLANLESAQLAKRSIENENQQLAAKAATARSRLAVETPVVEARASQPISNETISSTDKKTLQVELSQIQRLISDRKNLLDSLKSRKSGVSISVQPLVTKSGASLDSLRAQVSRGDGDVEQLAARLREIQTILQDDIGTLKRLSKL